MRSLLPHRILISALVFAAACSSESGTLPDAGDAGVTDTGSTEPDAGGVLQGRVVLSTDTLAFGAVVVTSTATLSMAITNPAANPVRVSLAQPAGPDAERFTRMLNLPVENGSFVIEGGGVVTMTVTVSPVALGPLLAVVALD